VAEKKREEPEGAALFFMSAFSITLKREWYEISDLCFFTLNNSPGP
jgi:hypothetical protein